MNSGHRGKAGCRCELSVVLNYLDLSDRALSRFGATKNRPQAPGPFTLRALLLPARADFFNIFTHPNFGPPIGDVTSSPFGYSTATLNSSLGGGGANGSLPAVPNR